MSGRHGLRISDGRQSIAAFRQSTLGATAILVLTVLGTPATARAFDKATCVDSHESAQKAMKIGRVRESKEQLIVCSDSSCPALVREDCEKWLSNLDRQPPPMTASETGSEPGLESAARDAPVASNRATGEREERERSNVANAASVANAAANTDRTEDLRAEGQKTPGSPAAVEASPPAKPTAPTGEAQPGQDGPAPGSDLHRAPAATSRHPVPAAAWVTGILALASFGTAASFGVTGWLDARSLRETCAPNCPSARVSDVRQNLLIADLSALTGLAFSAVAAWMVCSHGDAGAPEGSKPDATKLSASLTGHSFRLDYIASF